MPFADVYAGLPVLVTGHTGFKGSWLAIWLKELGADVAGFSLPHPPTVPANFEVCRLGGQIEGVTGDVRDHDALPMRSAASARALSFIWRRNRWCWQPTASRK